MAEGQANLVRVRAAQDVPAALARSEVDAVALPIASLAEDGVPAGLVQLLAAVAQISLAAPEAHESWPDPSWAPAQFLGDAATGKALVAEWLRAQWEVVGLPQAQFAAVAKDTTEFVTRWAQMVVRTDVEVLQGAGGSPTWHATPSLAELEAAGIAVPKAAVNALGVEVLPRALLNIYTHEGFLRLRLHPRDIALDAAAAGVTGRVHVDGAVTINSTLALCFTPADGKMVRDESTHIPTFFYAGDKPHNPRPGLPGHIHVWRGGDLQPEITG